MKASHALPVAHCRHVTQWLKSWDPCVFGRACGAATSAALTEVKPAWGKQVGLIVAWSGWEAFADRVRCVV